MRKTVLCVAVVIFGCSLALGQLQEKILYIFGTNGGPFDGYEPNQGLVMDKSGNLYGTTVIGGTSPRNVDNACDYGCGTVFELSPTPGGTWTETVIYSFCTSTGSPNSCPDGAFPVDGLTIDDRGNLYGVAPGGFGAVFQLSPPTRPEGSWTFTILATIPASGQLTLDAAGNLYGVAPTGGVYGVGTVFELSPPVIPRGGPWTETTLYTFCSFDNCSGGWSPRKGVVADKFGNLYGTTSQGSNGFVIYELSFDSGTWTETVLHTFDTPYRGFSGLTLDPAGNLYGTAPSGGIKGCGGNTCGVALRLKNSNWTLLSYRFNGQDGSVPLSGLSVDALTGSVYGTTEVGGTNAMGTVFQIKGKVESVLYSFCVQTNCADGSNPSGGGSLLLTGSKLYGTTAGGGSLHQGIVFEITP